LARASRLPPVTGGAWRTRSQTHLARPGVTSGEATRQRWIERPQSGRS